MVEVRGAWSQSPGFRSNSANVLGSLALGNKMLTEAAVLTAAHRVPSPALRKYRANIPQALSTVWGLKEGCFSDERAEAQRGEVICLRSHTAKSQSQDLSSVASDSRAPSLSSVLPDSLGLSLLVCQMDTVLAVLPASRTSRRGFSGHEKAGTIWQVVSDPGAGQLCRGAWMEGPA